MEVTTSSAVPPAGDGARIDTRVCVVDDGPAPEIEVVYDGRTPPHELFANWADLGWTPPTPALPPRDAIDWSTPDPVHGRRYTLRSFRAVGHAVVPAGAPDPARMVDGALAAARRLGYGVDGVASTTGPDSDALPAESTPAPEQAPAGEPTGLVCITTSQPPHAAPGLEARARDLGGRVHSHEVVTTRDVTYRGSTNTITTRVVELEIVIDRSEVSLVLDAASPHSVAPIDVVDVRDEPR
jgi:hypothetical protein